MQPSFFAKLESAGNGVCNVSNTRKTHRGKFILPMEWKKQEMMKPRARTLMKKSMILKGSNRPQKLIDPWNVLHLCGYKICAVF